MIVQVNDKMQQGYFYELSEPVGKNFAVDFKNQDYFFLESKKILV